ncbi:hypothetical protein [Hymenobacter baengnokdamensis]|uniref:hypothetical protein n=1 Tax=Hymenobacter baengnokdamensis TaxID=2615203 RepID=UPI001249171E|nr:hypothetical protein [Hymenobacter baengnokdamensis]
MLRYAAQKISHLKKITTLVLAGCTPAPAYLFVRNTTGGAVIVSIGMQRRKQPRRLRFSPKLLRPLRASIAKMQDSLAMTRTPAGITFRLPANSTVGLGYYFGLSKNIVATLRLQRADSTVQLLDSLALTQAVHYSYKIGGPCAWYDIQ